MREREIRLDKMPGPLDVAAHARGASPKALKAPEPGTGRPPMHPGPHAPQSLLPRCRRLSRPAGHLLARARAECWLLSHTDTETRGGECACMPGDVRREPSGERLGGGGGCADAGEGAAAGAAGEHVAAVRQVRAQARHRRPGAPSCGRVRFRRGLPGPAAALPAVISSRGCPPASAPRCAAVCAVCSLRPVSVPPRRSLQSPSRLAVPHAQRP